MVQIPMRMGCGLLLAACLLLTNAEAQDTTTKPTQKLLKLPAVVKKANRLLKPFEFTGNTRPSRIEDQWAFTETIWASELLGTPEHSEVFEITVAVDRVVDGNTLVGHFQCFRRPYTDYIPSATRKPSPERKRRMIAHAKERKRIQESVTVEIEFDPNTTQVAPLLQEHTKTTFLVTVKEIVVTRETQRASNQYVKRPFQVYVSMVWVRGVLPHQPRGFLFRPDESRW